jgi:nucleotide-binding universal stress UspA family protein
VSLLCCTDLSENSRPALQEALRLGHDLGTSVTVLHVCPPPFPDPSYLSLALEDADLLDLAGIRVRRSAQAALEGLLREAGQWLDPGHVPVRTVVRQGLAAKTIVEEAELEDTELIVMGTHGRSGLPHLLLGSVAERVMRTASRPVLTVPPGLR